MDLVSALRGQLDAAALEVPWRDTRYEAGESLEARVTTVEPRRSGRLVLQVERFVGGGFAGQVYRCVITVSAADGGGCLPGLEEGRRVGVKILIPPSRFAARFRDLVYGLGFQAPFTARSSEAACRAGLLWQRLIRRAAAVALGGPDAVADVYAWFFDERLQAYAEIREWVEGRMWRLEADPDPRRRRAWRTVDPRETGSPEFVAKRRFMARLVELLHRMGAPELARQYEWWTLKSQPNCLKRDGYDDDPAAGLCAFDFRAGLALLPVLPMSPADLSLIVRGIRRGSWVQFDRPCLEALRAFAGDPANGLADSGPLVEELAVCERTYRRSMPDITHQGWALMRDPELRRDVRDGLLEAYACDGRLDAAARERLARSGGAFVRFWLLGLLPCGRRLQQVVGRADCRRHLARLWREPAYRRRAWRAARLARLLRWHRAGRAGEASVRRLADQPFSFWVQALTLGLLPTGLHRAAAEPAWVRARLAAGWVFLRRFFREASFREAWLMEQVEDGRRQGMLSAAEYEEIRCHARDPYIVKYLRALAVHFATLPVTQIVSVTVGTAAVAWMLARGESWAAASGVFVGVLVFFQVFPVSPGSLCRGVYAVALMVRDRNVRDYVVAAPVSFVKYIGYLAFPLQMMTTYPALARFMASRWAMDAVRIVPVFGERGALLEHWVFDVVFNRPRLWGARLRRHAAAVLDGWMVLSATVFVAVARGCTLETRGAVNLLIAVVVLGLLPRLVFYPVLCGKERRSQSSSASRSSKRPSNCAS